MLDIKFVRENPEVVKENIRKKFQDEKIPLVGEVLKEDKELRQAQQHADDLRSKRKKISKEIGIMMSQGKKEEAEAIKAQISEIAEELDALEEREEKLRESVKNKMMQIPNILMTAFLLEKMILKMLNWKNMANQLFQILKFHIIQKSWKD